MAKAVVQTLEEVPEPLRGEYEPHEGKFRLKIDGEPIGYVPAAKHVEFRENNVRLIKALGADSVDSALARAAVLAGIDPSEYAALKAKAADLETRSGKKESEVEQLKGVLHSITERLDASEAARKASEALVLARSNEQLLRETISQRHLKAGGRPETLDFILSKARESFKVEDGQIKSDGKYNGKGDLITPDEWVTQATKDFGWAYQESKGGGASPAAVAGGANGAGASRPGVKRLVDPSPEDLGRLQFKPGKGLIDPMSGQVVEIVHS